MEKIFLICLTIICACRFTNCATADIPDVRTGEKSDALEKSKTRGTGEIFKPHIIELTQDIKTEPKFYSTTGLPPECLVVLREFIAYLSDNTPNIFYNREARRKWFASNMQGVAANHLAVYLRDSQSREFPTFPDNATLTGS